MTCSVELLWQGLPVLLFSLHRSLEIAVVLCLASLLAKLSELLDLPALRKLVSAFV